MYGKDIPVGCKVNLYKVLMEGKYKVQKGQVC